MSRGVLGNDPFRRGAAARPDEKSGNDAAKADPKASPKKRAAKARKSAAAGKRAQATAPVTQASAADTAKDPRAGNATAPIPAAASNAVPPKARAKAKPSAAAAGPSRRTAKTPAETSAASPSASSTGKRTAARKAETSSMKKPAGVSPAKEAPHARDAKEAPPAQPSRHLTPVAPPPASEAAPASEPGGTGAQPGATVVPLPARDRAPAPARPGAPHLMLVSEGTPAPVEPPEPRFLRDEDDLATRAGRAFEFVRDLAAAGLQGPTLTRTARVGRGLFRAALSGVGSLWGQQVDPYGRDPQLVEDLEPLAELLYAHYWRVTVQGAVHVPAGPVLLVANHAGVIPFDGPVLQQVLSRERPDLAEPRWLVEDQIFHAPFFGTLFNRLGALRACPQNARRLLSEKRPVIVFPEGAQGLGKPYRERGQLKRFGRGGFVKIALRAQVPIVPVAIVGSEETSPLMARLPGSVFGLGYIPVTPLGPLPLPARWMVRFGEPLNLDGAGPDDADNLPVVQRLSERTRDSIQGMREALLRERGAAYFG